MLYDYDGDGDHFSAEFLQVPGFRCAIQTNIGIVPYGLRSVPTHTEDGIPIRKLFVSNLPPKTTRKELFDVFCQYGFIKSCWVRVEEMTPSRNPGSSYAFVTFKNPDDAHKALQAPKHEKSLRGWNLRTFPADSWHQPVEEADGQVIWKNKGPRDNDFSYRERNELENDAQRTLENGESSNCESATQIENEEEESYNILDILNNDCLTHILSYVPIRDLIRSERVSKSWQVMVNEYLNGYRTFKTSWWQHGQVMLTTAILRKILQRLGPSLQRLHIDHRWSALNDRTAHTVGKFCPNLEELKIVSMHTKNWNPLVYGCKQLKAITFVSCNKLTDANLVHLVKTESCIEKLAVAYNSHVTGLFLTGANPPMLKSLSFFNCFSLQGTVLSAAMDTLSNLTTLKLDVGPVTLWKMIPSILNKLPKLEELSLSQYSSMEACLVPQGNSDFCESISNLKELKHLNVNRNIYISDVLLKQVAQSCRKLEYLNVSNCNPRKSIVNAGVTDVGITAVCNSCTLLRHLDVSYLSQLSNEGIASAARCSQLSVLTSRGNATLLAQPFAQCVASCHNLKEVDVCGCNNVTEELVNCAVAALKDKPRPLMLRLASTAVLAQEEELPTHRLLTVNLKDDLCDPQLRPDFVDRMFDESSDDSLDDYDFFDPDNYEDFMDSDNGFNLDELVEDFEYMYGAYEDVVLL